MLEPEIEIEIEIIEVITEANALTFRYRANRQLKHASFYTEIIYNYLCNTFYTDGIRSGEVDKVFSDCIENKDYKYLIAFLREHHKV